MRFHTTIISEKGDYCFSVVKREKLRQDPTDPAVRRTFKRLKVAVECGPNEGQLWPDDKTGITSPAD